MTQRVAERRQNLAQGEASAASETLGFPSLKNLARFSGRKTFLSPAKAGSLNACRINLGLRSACPGLNCAVRSADSLRRTSNKSPRPWVLIFLVLVCAFAACTRQSGGITAGTGGIPQLSATPTQVSSSADVVRVTTYSVQTAAGSSTKAVVRLGISSGYHVHANPATYPYLIATEVKAGTGEGITAEKPAYPTATKQKFEFAEEPLAVYQGMVDIELPLKISSALSAGQHSLPVSVRVQACDNEKCFPPVTLDAKILVDVK